MGTALEHIKCWAGYGKVQVNIIKWDKFHLKTYTVTDVVKKILEYAEKGKSCSETLDEKRSNDAPEKKSECVQRAWWVRFFKREVRFRKLEDLIRTEVRKNLAQSPGVLVDDETIDPTKMDEIQSIFGGRTLGRKDEIMSWRGLLRSRALWEKDNKPGAGKLMERMGDASSPVRWVQKK